MLTVPGYTFLSPLISGRFERMDRYLRVRDSKKVILKIPRSDNPTNSEITSIEHEYYLLTQLSSPNIIQAKGLIQNQIVPILELEDIEGMSLEQFLRREPLPLEQFFFIALQLVDLVKILHLNNIIHKDFNPTNIIINPTNLNVKLVDLSIAIQVNDESEQHDRTNLYDGILEGTLAYMSPEQTGRMNRPIDYRTDFYSLGVTFFEMLVGELPFRKKDPLELAYEHMAKLPPLVSDLNPQVPKMLARLVAKLLAKSPEERYAHSNRLESDLKRCATEWLEKGKIRTFTLGQHDVPDKLQFSHKLYGREKQISLLLESYEEVKSGASKLVFISGYPGIGKSSLISELQKSITLQRGYLIRGEFDQLQKTPYSGFTSAFQDLVKQLLTQPENLLNKTKEQLLAALGSNARVIIDVIPKVELLTGEQPAVPSLNPTESQNRFDYVFQNFVQAFARLEHPLVIFLDDLQWSDNASLKLIETLLLKFNTKYLLLIGAYRDNEVKKDHPVFELQSKFQKTHVPYETISLQTLTQHDVEELLSDLFLRSDKEVEELTTLITAKTQGNPFFINEFLKILYQNKLIFFSREEEKWSWNISEIETQAIADNVVDLLVDKIHKLSEESQKTLTLAACIGQTFELHTLAAIREQSLTQTVVQLGEARSENLIITLGDLARTGSEVSRVVKLMEEDYKPQFEFKSEKLTYRFEHDRIWQTAYSLIPESARVNLHFKIGNLLLKDKPLQESDERLFILVDHLNKGIDLISDSIFKRELSQYNYWAGQKAKLSTAYDEAKRYLEAGIACLSENSWDKDFDLTLALHKDYLETLYLLGDFDKADEVFLPIQNRIANTLQRVEIALIRIRAYAGVGRHNEAIDYAMDALQLISFPLPKKIKRLHILYQVFAIRLLIGNKPIANLDKVLMPMTHERDVAINKLLVSIIPSSFLTANSNLLAYLICTMLHHCLTKGYSEDTAYVCLNYASIMIAQFDNIKFGFDLVQLADKLTEKSVSKEQACKINMIKGTFLDCWQHHAFSALTYLDQDFKLGLEIGNLEYAVYAQRIPFILLYVGKKLQGIDIEIQRFKSFSYQTKNTPWYAALSLIENLSHHLQDVKIDVESQRKYLKSVISCDIVSLKASICALYSTFCYLCGNFEECQKYSNYFHKNKIGIKGIILDSAFGWLSSALVICRLYAKSSDSAQKSSLKRLLSIKGKFKKWASYSPTNFEFMYLWLSVEIDRIQNLNADIESKYFAAYESAQKNEYILYAGAICESAAEYYLSQANSICAEAYVRRALLAYRRCGAQYKVRMLNDKFANSVTVETLENDINNDAGSGFSAQSLDVATVLKSAQVISREINLVKFLEKLLLLSMETSGAQKGALIFEEHKKLIVVAQGTKEKVTVNIEGIPLEDCHDLPKSVINYVWYTNENILLEDSDHMEQFQHDVYIQVNKPKSVLCVPILNKRQSAGYLYLENQLTPNAFTADRMQILRLLGGQTAISLENAKLYSAIDRFVPYEFLRLLNKSNLVELKLGDSIEKQMSVLFCDIRNFTTVSENLPSAKVFNFIVDFFGYFEPDIKSHHGIIDRYIGDAILILYESADEAVQSGLDMLRTLKKFNSDMTMYPETKIGIGINTGMMTVGIIGQKNRVEVSLVGDAVNTASRIQNLTKTYHVDMLIGEETKRNLTSNNFDCNAVGEVPLKGKALPVMIYTVKNLDDK